jgi:hypothetical protein
LATFGASAGTPTRSLSLNVAAAGLRCVRRGEIRKAHVRGLGRKGVAVDLKGEGWAVVPELFRDEYDVGPRLKRESRVGVATRMHDQMSDFLGAREGMKS